YFMDQGLNVTLKPQSNTYASMILEYTPEQLRLMQDVPPLKAHQSFINRAKNNLVEYKLENETLGLFTSDTEYRLPQAEMLNSFDFNQFRGWKCNAGYQSIIIREPGGEVKRGYSCADEILGTLDTGFTLFTEPKPCITARCVSSADSKIP